MSRVISYLHNPDNLEVSEDKCFVCVVDGIVVGNIIKFTMKLETKLDNNLVPVVLPDWQIFLKILQSPNHQFIERPIPVFPGTIWNGEEFIAPVIEETVVNEEITQVNEEITPVNEENNI